MKIKTLATLVGWESSKNMRNIENVEKTKKSRIKPIKPKDLAVKDYGVDLWAHERESSTKLSTTWFYRGIFKSQKTPKIVEIECYKDLRKTIESLTTLKKNLCLDLSGELKVLVALSKSYKKVYSVVNDFKKAEELFRSLKELGIQNVGITVSETIPDFEFRFNLAVSLNTLNETELEKLKSFSDFVLLINRECHQNDMGTEKSYELIKN